MSLPDPAPVRRRHLIFPNLCLNGLFCWSAHRNPSIVLVNNQIYRIIIEGSFPPLLLYSFRLSWSWIEQSRGISPSFRPRNLHFENEVFSCETHMDSVSTCHCLVLLPFTAAFALHKGTQQLVSSGDGNCHPTLVWRSCFLLCPWRREGCSFLRQNSLLLLVAKLRKLGVWFPVWPVIGGRFALSRGKGWLRVLVQPSSEHLDWADVLRRQKWGTIHGESVFALEGRCPESTISRKKIWCFKIYSCFSLLTKILLSNIGKAEWISCICREGRPCWGFARAGVAELMGFCIGPECF